MPRESFEFRVSSCALPCRAPGFPVGVDLKLESPTRNLTFGRGGGNRTVVARLSIECSSIELHREDGFRFQVCRFHVGVNSLLEILNLKPRALVDPTGLKPVPHGLKI